MKRLLLFLALASPVFGTTVTGTIVDPNNNPYANGTASAYSLTASGQPGTSTTPVATNINGAFSMVLAPATYIFTICAPPVALGPLVNPAPRQTCFSSNPVAVSGASLDVSSVMNPLAVILGPSKSATGLSSPAGLPLPAVVPGGNQLQFDPITNLPDCSTNGAAFIPCSGGIAGAVLLSPSLPQNVVQTSAGRPSEGTALNANDFEQVRYVDQFQWLQSPAGSISVGVNTVSINAIRGISTYSCASPGIGCAATTAGNNTTHFIRIAGTGTPEQVKITGTSCTGSSTGTCTVTFTAVNTHAAGFTLGTATAGFMEALVDAYTLVTTNPATGRAIACSPYTNSGHYIIYSTIFMDDIAASQSPQTFLLGNGCVLEDAVHGGPMINITGTNSAHVTMENFTLATFAGVGRSANGLQVFVLDQGQLFHFTNNRFACPSTGCTVDVVDTAIEISNDQGATIDHNDFEGVPMKCDTTWCGPMIYGDAVNNAAIADISDNYFSNNEDPIKWDSGNGLTIKDNVFQNWVHYPWKYRGGLLSFSNQGGNYYEGNCNLINPDFGVIGFSCNTGPQVENSGSVTSYTPSQERNAFTNTHRFASTGGNVLSYFIVGNQGGKSTRPLYIGDAASDLVTPVNLSWLKFGATTYDLLVTGPALNDGTDAAPWGINNQAVATGLSCSSNPCTATDSFGARSSYQVLAEFQSLCYAPNIDYWPVPLFVHGSSTSPTTYIGPLVPGFVNSSCTPNGIDYYDAVFTSELGGAGPITGMHILHQMAIGNSGASPGAMILSQDQGVVLNLRKGRINFPSFLSIETPSGMTNSLLVQTYDSQSNKTFATQGHQGTLVSADCGMGYDTNVTYLMFMCGNPISFYLGHVPDAGTSPVFQLLSTGPKSRLQYTSTLATGTAPFSITSTTPVANLAATPTTYNAAGTQQTNAHVVEGTCTLGTSCAVTFSGSAVFTGAATYACTAQDTTAIAATKAVQASGSSVTFTGTGTDVLVYSCVGD